MSDSPARRAIDRYRARLDEYVAVACDRVRAADLAFYRAMPLEAMRASVKRIFESVALDLERETPQSYPALLSALGAQRAAMGVSVTEVTLGMQHGFEVVSEAFAEQFADDPAPRLFWENMRGKIAYAGVAALADAYLGAREKLLRAQADEILQLSTQVLPLYPGVLVCPLIGRLDRERGQAMTAAILAAIGKHQARVVVLDLSGVPAVDGEMAGHLGDVGRAIALLGARLLLVGISAPVAQAIVSDALDLGRVTVLGDLASGLGLALGLLGKAIVDR